MNQFSENNAQNAACGIWKMWAMVPGIPETRVWGAGLRRCAAFLLLVPVLTGIRAEGQAVSTAAPNVSQVLLYSAVAQPGTAIPTGTIPSIFTENGQTAFATDFASGVASQQANFTNVIFNASNYSASQTLVNLTAALNGSIATALSIIPLSSPASGVIDRVDPTTGAELSVNGTLGPIFTERAETIGKGKWYIGFSHQDFHFTRFNGQSLNALSLLYPGGDASKSKIIGPNGSPLPTVASTFNVGMDARLSQDIAFITYGVTDHLDVSVGLPVVHAAIAARTYNGIIYAGNGFASNGSTCWCVSTFTPGNPLISLPQIGQSSKSNTGFGDLLARVKGTVIHKSRAVLAVGADVRLPTGDEQNYLGVGAASVKPFVAMSVYTNPFRNGIVLSPHFDAGWQFTGKSILGGLPQATSLTGNNIGAPFTFTKDYLPDVFSWAVGAELAFGRHNTVIADILGNQVGWIHGIQDTITQSIPGALLPTAPNGTIPADFTHPLVNVTPMSTTATGILGIGRVSQGQYNGSFGYKARIGSTKLVANFNLLVRLDNNGLTARVVPLYGLGYSF